MNLFNLIIRNLKYYRKEHLLLFIGMILSTAILTSALIIGDSVKYSLNSMISTRLGKTQQIIQTQERFFPASFSQTLSKELKINTAPILLMRGIASSDNSEVRLPDVQVCGVDLNFWEMGNCKMPDLNDNEVIINQKLAEKLKLKVGEEILIRIEKANFVTDNAPFVSDDNNSIAVRMKVKAISDEKSFGNFNIRTNQVTPYNVYFSLPVLSKLNFGDSFANLMLISENNKTVEEINQAIKNCWSMNVINLKFKRIVKQNKLELNSDRIFIEDTIRNLLRKENFNPQPVFTYLINYIDCKTNSTPYSFVSALSNYPGIELGKNEIIINSWLAKDLNAEINDTVQLKYFTLGAFRKLKEKNSKFIVRKIVEIQGFAADSLLMPAFEGLAGVDKCSDWKAGIPVDFSKIRPKDETWWKRYKGTPKAFISYDTATQLWGNSFGNTTSIRFDLQTDTTKIKQILLAKLHPANVGLNVIDVKTDSGWSASNAEDFGQLFLSLSFFLILAAFLLTGLLFSMMMVQRRKEQGIYLSVGLSQQKIFRIFLGEGLLNAVIGSFAGIFAGVWVGNLVLHFINSIWYDIVRTSSVQLCVLPATLFTGFISNVLLSAIVIRQILKSHFKKQIGDLNKNTAGYKVDNLKRRQNRIFTMALSTSFLFAAVLIYGLQKGMYQNSSLFFITGFLLLIALIAWFAFLLLMIRNSNRLTISPFKLAIRNLSFDYKRNLTISAILAIGIFIVISTGANREDSNRDINNNNSGSGGYKFYIETNIGVNADLSTPEGRNKTGIENDYQNFSIVQMHRLESDDASCLNLNKVKRPTILGVNPNIFAVRNSFSFVKTLKMNEEKTWKMLNHKLGKNCIPAFADQTVITWGLGKSVGDSLTYINEKGDTIYIVLVGGIANSVFQGNLIISDDNFIKHFPSISGSNVMLVDVKSNQCERLKENLEGAFRNQGIKIENTAERLQTFNSVSNTYLDIFLALGALALIIGTFGIAVTVIRTIHSRKNQYAMMQAYGISGKCIRNIIAIEFIIVIFTGIFIGLVAAIMATLPGLLTVNSDIPFFLLGKMIAIFVINGMFWIFVGISLSLKVDFMANLRNE